MTERPRCRCGLVLSGRTEVDGKSVAGYFCYRCDGHGVECIDQTAKHALTRGCRYRLRGVAGI